MKVRKINLFVFFSSISFSILLLCIERVLGIGIDFHPDSVHYLSESKHVVTSLFRNGDFFNFLNNGFYFIVWSLNSKAELVLSLNILIYSLTNVLLFQNLRTLSKKFNFGILFIIFSPYRTHLAVHVLKDTLFIFFSVWLLNSLNGRRKYFNLLFSFFTIIWIRVFGVLNLFFDSRIQRYFKYGFLILILFLVFGIGNTFNIWELIEARNIVDMGGRSFDTIPNFINYGVFGAFLRFVFWPVIFITGLFVLISPSLLFFPISIELFLSNFFVKWKYRNIIPFLLISGLIALLVNTFTAYTRYVFPIYVLSLLSKPQNS